MYYLSATTEGLIFYRMTTPKLASNVWIYVCRRCTLLAGNSSISLAGSEDKRINFSQQSPKMLKMASESFIHVLLLFLDLFLKISRWVPLNSQTRVSSSETINLVIPLETNTFQDYAFKIFNSLPPAIKSCTNFCFFSQTDLQHYKRAKKRVVI